MNESSEQLASQFQELRRGTIVLAILAKLRQPHYGYALVHALESGGIGIEPGTLYPLLRRLEAQGLLASTWDTTENRPRKYYQLSPQGEAAFAELTAEWSSLSANLTALINEG